jgi:hypothetical protein
MSTDKPIACTLSPADIPARLDEWRAVVALANTREATDGGERLRFPHDAELAARLAALAVAETGCCSFFTISVMATGDDLWLTVEAPVEGRPLVDQLLG